MPQSETQKLNRKIRGSRQRPAKKKENAAKPVPVAIHQEQRSEYVPEKLSAPEVNEPKRADSPLTPSTEQRKRMIMWLSVTGITIVLILIWFGVNPTQYTSSSHRTGFQGIGDRIHAAINSVKGFSGIFSKVPSATNTQSDEYIRQIENNVFTTPVK